MSSFSFTEFSEFQMDGDVYRNFFPAEATCVATEFPVYRSVAVMDSSSQLLGGNDASVDMPHLSKDSISKPTVALTSMSEESFQISEFESFDFLEPADFPPSVGDLGFCPLSSTHFCLDMSTNSAVQIITKYLKQHNICAKYICGKFRWVCEVEHEFEYVKFEIQLYSDADTIIVEFQRLRGTSVIFTRLFGSCKSEMCEGVVSTAPVSPRSVLCSFSPPVCHAANTCSIVEWIRSDPVEGVKVLCEMISGKSIDCEHDFGTVRDACSALVSRDLQALSPMPILSLARCLVHKHKEQQIAQISSLFDILIPSVARNACAAGASDYIVKYSSELMESVSRI